jgi:hypothetical protein
MVRSQVAYNALSIKFTMIVWVRKFEFQLIVFSSAHDYESRVDGTNVIFNTGKQSLTLLPNIYYDIIM